jgi:Domain of unknown function (DUF4112)
VGAKSSILLQERERRVRRLVAIARVMDTAVRLPGTNIRFGADAVIGLLPGFGDVGSAVVSLLLINEARRLEVPNNLLVRMLYNVALDSAIGVIPLLGDVFDAYFKSNKRNADMILDHFKMRD